MNLSMLLPIFSLMLVALTAGCSGTPGPREAVPPAAPAAPASIPAAAAPEAVKPAPAAPEVPPVPAAPPDAVKVEPPKADDLLSVAAPEVAKVLPAVSPFTLLIEPARGAKAIETPILLKDILKEEDLADAVEAQGTKFSFLRFAPSMGIQEKILAAPEGGGPPALRFSIESEGQASETWLVPGSRILGRASFRSAVVEYIPALAPEEQEKAVALFKQIQTPTRKLLLERKSDGTRMVLSADPGRETVVEGLDDYRIEILKVFNCFAIDPKTGEASDQDARPLNPAAQVKITHAGKSRTTWLFSQLPEFSRDAEDEVAAVRFVWPIEGHPHQRAEILMVDSAGPVLKAFIGLAGQSYQAELPLGKAVSFMELKLNAVERIPASRIEQTAAPKAGGKAAVLLSWEAAGKKEERWIPVGVREEIRIGEAVFGARLLQGAGGKAAKAHAGMDAPQEPPSLPAGHPKIDGGADPGAVKLPAGHPKVDPPKLPAGHPQIPKEPRPDAPAPPGTPGK